MINVGKSEEFLRGGASKAGDEIGKRFLFDTNSISLKAKQSKVYYKIP